MCTPRHVCVLYTLLYSHMFNVFPILVLPCRTAFSGIQNLVTYYPDMRCDVAKGFVMFVVREVPDTYPQELEYSLKILLQILTYWRTTVVNENTPQVSAGALMSAVEYTLLPVVYIWCTPTSSVHLVHTD